MIDLKESEIVEFKPSLSQADRIVETVASMANRNKSAYCFCLQNLTKRLFLFIITNRNSKMAYFRFQ